LQKGINYKKISDKYLSKKNKLVEGIVENWYLPGKNSTIFSRYC